MTELILQKGELGELKNGWTLAFINALETNGLVEIASAVRLSK